MTPWHMNRLKRHHREYDRQGVPISLERWLELHSDPA